MRKLQQWAGFRGMVKQDIFAQLLSNCIEAQDLAQGRTIHAAVVSSEHRLNWFLHNYLIQMYGRCGSVEEARAVFDGIPQPNLFSWNSLLTAYAANGHAETLKSVFDSMEKRNVVSWSLVLQAFSQNSKLDEVKLVFERLPGRSVVSCNAVIAAYAQKGYLEEAKEVFDGMPELDVVTWTAMIQAHAQAMQLEEAKLMFDSMPLRDEICWNVAIAMYAHNGQVSEAVSLFERAPQLNVHMWNSLLVSHAFVGENLETLSLIFDSMPERNSTSWITAIHAYALHVSGDGQLHKAVDSFNKAPMQAMFPCTTMILAYAQSGHFEEARSLFSGMQERDALAWNVMISASTQKSPELSSDLFREMSLEGMPSDHITFTSLLVGCGSRGWNNQCVDCFSSMPVYGVAPTHEHFACMVDMLAKSGRLEEAEELINNMPFWPEIATWGALLSACNIHWDDRCLSYRATVNALVLNPRDSFPYSLFANAATKTQSS